jgi:Flp pilus assembly protein TadG
MTPTLRTDAEPGASGGCCLLRGGLVAVCRGPVTRTSLASDRNATTAVEFAICALAMVLIVVGFVEFGRLVWTLEALQETASEGARCMGLRASACASAGVYSSANTKNYVVTLAASRGVVITTAVVSLSNTATCGGASGFSQVSINYQFVTVAPELLTSLVNGFVVPASACFPNNS